MDRYELVLYKERALASARWNTRRCDRGGDRWGRVFARVLWFDLMFDVQVGRRVRSGDLPEELLASICGYYRRVTTTARPMNRLTAAVMVMTVGAIGFQPARGDAPRWVVWTSLVLAGSAIVLAALRTVPSAVRLGARTDPVCPEPARTVDLPGPPAVYSGDHVAAGAPALAGPVTG